MDIQLLNAMFSFTKITQCIFIIVFLFVYTSLRVYCILTTDCNNIGFSIHVCLMQYYKLRTKKKYEDVYYLLE